VLAVGKVERVAPITGKLVEQPFVVGAANDHVVDAGDGVGRQRQATARKPLAGERRGDTGKRAEYDQRQRQTQCPRLHSLSSFGRHQS